MAGPPSADDIREALDDYIEQANGSESVQRTLSNWRCVLHFSASDSAAAFTVTVEGGRIADARDGLVGQADLALEAEGAELAAIFWGEANPAERYNEGAVRIRGPQEHLMRLDAMAMLIFLGS
jgi:hypothetical protein